MNKNTINISDDIANAMASKITFEAEQFRKKKDEYNYFKMDFKEEE